MSTWTRKPTGRIELTVSLALLAIITGAGVGLALARRNPVDPRLAIASAELTFGPVWEQPAFRHAIQVHNPSDRTVRVSEVRSGCGCTSIEPQAFEIPAGGKRELIATLNLAGYADKPFEVELVPTIAHQAPDQRTTWVLRGEVRANPIVLDQTEIHLDDRLIVGEPSTPYEIDMSLAEEAPFETLRATGLEEYGEVELDRIAERRWRMRIIPAGDLPPGPIRDTIRIEAISTDGVAPAHREISVTGTVRPEIGAWPEALTLGVRDVGTTAEEYVVLASATGRAFDVARIDAPPGVTVIAQGKKSNETRLAFLVRQDIAAPQAQSSTIQFHIRRREPRAGESVDGMVPVEISYHGLETATRK